MKKISSVLYLLAIFGILYAANRVDQRHFETAQHTLNSIYKDRVVAQNIIYQLNSIFNKRLLSYYTLSSKDDSKPDFSGQDATIFKLLDEFRETKLTKPEAASFAALEKNYQKLLKLEERTDFSLEENKSEHLQTLEQIAFDLNQLSQIQVTESSNLKALGKKSLETKRLMSMTEIALMVLILIVILFFIFYKGFK